MEKAGEDIAEDSDSEVLCSEIGNGLIVKKTVNMRNGKKQQTVNRSVSGFICRLGTKEQERGSEKFGSNLNSTLSNEDLKHDPSDPNHKRVYLNHRSVTRLKDIKYKRISKTKSKSMEELRDKLRQGEHFSSYS